MRLLGCAGALVSPTSRCCAPRSRLQGNGETMTVKVGRLGRAGWCQLPAVALGHASSTFPARRLTVHHRPAAPPPCSLQVKTTTKFTKIIDAYCNKKGVDPATVRLTFEGDRIEPTQTPEEVRARSSQPTNQPGRQPCQRGGPGKTREGRRGWQPRLQTACSGLHAAAVALRVIVPAKPAHCLVLVPLPPCPPAA